MKNKIFGILKGRVLAWLLALVLLVPIACVTGLVGVCYTAKLSGETEVRPGHSFTLRLSMDSGAFGCQGILSYDSSVLKLKGVEPVNRDLLKECYDNSDTGFVMVTHNEAQAKQTDRIIRFFDGRQVE